MSKNDPLIHNIEKIECVMHKDIEEDSKITSLTPLKLNYLKSFIFWTLVLFTGGILLLICHWLPQLRIKLTYSPSDIHHSSKVHVVSKYFREFTDLFKISSKEFGDLTVFKYQELSYYFNGQNFQPLYFNSSVSTTLLIDSYSLGYSSQEKIEEKRKLYGKCLILVPVTPLFKMIVSEMFNPFYIFQVYSVILWYFEEYYLYGIAIVIITTISLATSIVTTRRGMISLHNLAKRECKVKVVRKGKSVEISSIDLVPGDLVEVVGQMELPCDLCLISGGAIVEEGMLTGESVPVIKDMMPYIEDYIYDPDLDKRHTLYEGTKVIQTRNYAANPVQAIVVRTGFMTVKGRLVRSIMYPKPNKFKLYQDSLKFIGFLACLTCVGFVVCLPRMIYLDYADSTIALRVLDLITITVPPALPACMAAGVSFAVSRLSKAKIFCISPNRVNVAGRIDMMVFDKTGTLTEDGMNLLGVQPSSHGNFENMTQSPKDAPQKLIECMASCHSLALVSDKLLGDTQDLQIFNSTGWIYSEPDQDVYDPLVKAIVKPVENQDPSQYFNEEGQIVKMIDLQYELGILHTFHFTSKLKRMGVITKNLTNNEVIFYSKGAPEVLVEKCVGVPENINQVLAEYTTKGYRVMACACKGLENLNYAEMKSLKLESLERNLEFLGLIILQNKLKLQTLPSLKVLRHANIKTVMATGDAVLTGISVAKECNLIDALSPVYLGEVIDNEVVWQIFDSHDIQNNKRLDRPPWFDRGFEEDYVLAMTGGAFIKLIKEEEPESSKILRLCLEKCQVYARMAPEHKTLLVEKLQEIGYLVGMCGDGANDCGALKAADVGVSLSEADSSIAAPFTSKVSDISSVVTVLIEGRCALTTSVQCFKFMALYSMIQFTSASILYWFLGNLTNNQYLVFDLITVMPLAIFMSKTDPYHKLSPHAPSSTLISFRILTSVSTQAFLQLIFQVGTYAVAVFTYYSYPDIQPGDNPGNYTIEDTIIFYISWLQYLVVCITFSVGKPWKKPSYTNFLLTFYQCGIGFTIFLTLFRHDGTVHYLFDVKFM